MNFQQLRILRETVRLNFNLTEVANALCTPQSGVSKHILDLEDELGVELFVRKGKRILGLTQPGDELVAIANRILIDAGNMKQLASNFNQQNEGRLDVVTTHTQARYALPSVVARFKQEFPKVHLVLHQAGPAEIVQMLVNGQADIGLATEALDTEYPVITYHEGMTGRRQVDNAFEDANLVPDIVMAALDADVIKTYVELGLGIGIVASMAFDEERDVKLRLVNCGHLFKPNTTRIAVRKGHYLRGYACRFIELCSPALNEATVRAKAIPSS